MYTVGRNNVYIAQVQALDGCRGRLEEWRGHTLDCVAITVDCACIAIDWSPLLACHIDIGNKDYILLQGCCLLGKSLQRSLIPDYKGCSIWCVGDSVSKLAHSTHSQRLLLASLDGCIHYTTVGVVQGYIQLVVRACRHSYVDVGWSVVQNDTLAKRVINHTL